MRLTLTLTDDDRKTLDAKAATGHTAIAEGIQAYLFAGDWWSNDDVSIVIPADDIESVIKLLANAGLLR